jgi:DnaJ like chaperone protein
MAYWGKFFGGMAGFAVGGPVGALFGAAMGHAADQGVVGSFAMRFGQSLPFDSAARIAAMLGQRDQLFAIAVTVLAAKLAKCDGPVGRNEIDAFRQAFRIPDESVAEIGRLFDQARDSSDGFESYALQLGQAFADNRMVLEQVLAGLHHIARADGPINGAEADFLARVAHCFGLDLDTAQRAGRGVFSSSTDDAYAVLGLDRKAGNDEIKTRWKQLMRENHPDSLSAKGMSAAAIKAASDHVAKINAAYDSIKRERKL